MICVYDTANVDVTFYKRARARGVTRSVRPSHDEQRIFEPTFSLAHTRARTAGSKVIILAALCFPFLAIPLSRIHDKKISLPA